MSSHLLADLDSFYQQQPSTVDGKTHDIEEDWGDFQESRNSESKYNFGIDEEFSRDNQASTRYSNGTNLLYDAVEELGVQNNSQKLLTESARPITPAIRREDSTSLTSATINSKAANKTKGENDLLIFNTAGSETSQNLSRASKPIQKPESSPKTTLALREEEEWEDFALTPAVSKTLEVNALVNLNRKDDVKSQSQLNISEQEIPPNNVPPPAFILTLFLQVMSQCKSELLRLKASCKGLSSHVEDPGDAEFLRAYVETARVLARVIAGRKLRWKRDQLLSQGMKIGPASTKRATGMKVASIDKAEMGKEEKEVLDTVELWREQLGRLRTVVAGFTSNGFDKIGTIPDIRPNIPVKVLNENEGGISSTRSCALCGLKRNERVSKVDVSVHDSFGEWWIETTSMHRTCKYFWQSHKSKLQTN